MATQLDFNTITQRAKKLIQMEGKINEMAKSHVEKGDISLEEGVTPTMMTQQQPSATRQFQTETMGSMASKLPKEIVESFANNVIDPSSLEGGSVLDAVNVEVPQKKVIKEDTRPQVSQTIPSAGGIDYSLIKTIVESAVKKYVGAYTKKILSEGVGSKSGGSELKAIRLGESFNFITNDGDLYEAKLVFKKNIKK